MPIRIFLAAHGADHEVVALVNGVLSAAGRDLDAVGVHDPLWDESQFGENGWVPLDDVFLCGHGSVWISGSTLVGIWRK